jgi:hypothetical protein
MNANVNRVQELRRSNAASAVPARKVRRQRTRAASKRAAIREHS